MHQGLSSRTMLQSWFFLSSFMWILRNQIQRARLTLLFLPTGPCCWPHSAFLVYNFVLVVKESNCVTMEMNFMSQIGWPWSSDVSSNIILNVSIRCFGVRFAYTVVAFRHNIKYFIIQVETYPNQ